MKRLSSILLILILALLSACSGTKTVSTGLGITTGIGSSVPAKDGKDGTAQVDSAVAAITLDSEGTILKLTIDAPQTRVVFSSKGKITSGLSAPVQSKLERGDQYGMRNHSEIGKEWYEQIAAFEAWAVGKTVDEVLGLSTRKVDETRQKVPDVPELTASVTITVGDYMKAIEKAAANAKPAETGEVFRTGLGIVTRAAHSVDASADAEGYAQVDSVAAALTLNDKGKIIACSVDVAQTRVPFTATGELAADLTGGQETLGESGDPYGEQAAAFAAWAIGKTMEEVKEGQPPTGVSVDVGDFILAMEKAAAGAK